MLDSRERFQLVVLDQLGEGVIVADADGKIVTVNRAAEEIHGRVKLDVPPDEYSETYELLTLDDEPYPSTQLPLAKAVNEGVTVIDAPWKIRRPDKSVVIAVGTARPIIDEDGEQIGAVLTMRDETLRYHAEQQLKEALRVKETLLYEVNHRVRNSLQVVSSIVSMHRHSVQDPDALEALENAGRRIDVITATHRSLYELGTHDWVDCTYLLPDLCKQIVETYQQQTQVSINVDARGTVILGVSHAVSLCLAVTELVTNACKYAFPERTTGEIHLLLDATGDDVHVRISDDGVGMDEAAADVAPQGIGTMIVSGLAHGIGADIARETSGSGTSFSIRFPRQAESLDQVQKAFVRDVDQIEDHWQLNRLA